MQRRECKNCKNWICEKVIFENKRAGIPYDSIGKCNERGVMTEWDDFCEEYDATP